MPSSKLIASSRLSLGPIAKLVQGPRASTDLHKTGAGLIRGAGQQSKLVNAAWSNTWPAPGATLDLDFANNRGFVRGVGQGGVMDAITFTRASIGKYVDSSGIVQDAANNAPRFDWASTATVAQKNLLTYTEQFDNAAWTKVASSVTANATTAPDGTNTADFLIESATTAIHYFQYGSYISFSNTEAVFSIRLAPAGRRYVQIFWSYNAIPSNPYANFDLVDGVVAAVSSGITATISATTNGFFICSAKSVFPSLMFPCVALIDSATAARGASYAGNGTSGIYVWGAQLEVGSSATAYQAVAQPTTNTPLAANPTCNGLLIEESRTNRLLWCRDARGINVFANSQAFAQSTWAKTGLSASDNTADTVAPDGTSTASKITVSGGSARAAYTANVPTGTYTISVCLKKGATNVAISLVNATTATTFATFDPDAPSGNYTNLGNGWFRFWGSGTVSPGNEVRVSAASEGIGEYFYLWGAQMEIGSSFTSYEATTSNWAAFVKTSITAAKNQTGIDGVANAASSLTASADGGTCIQTITLASGSRTGSVYLKRITGTGNVQVSLDGSTWSTVDLSNGLWNRIVLSGTVTNPVVGIKLVTNGDAVAMDYGQVEDGAFATSPVLTTTATATRSADNSTMTGSNLHSWLNRNQGTIFTSLSYGNLVGGYSFVLGPGLGANRVILSSTGDMLTVGFNVVTQPVPLPINTFGLISGSYSNNRKFSANVNGGKTVEGFNALYVGGLSDTLSIGFSGSSSYMDGTIKRLVYFPKEYTADGLKDLTTGAT